MDALIILLIALAFDLVFGEPGNTWHPVAWLGKLISLETKWAKGRDKPIQLFLGTVMVLLTLLSITAAIYFVILHLREVNWWISVIFAGLLLKFTFSLRGLRQAVAEVKRALAKNEIAQARHSLKALVSRDTTNLDKSQVISATVESATENSCDSFVAPLFYFLLLGLPGAVAYRIINTFDAMIGYHGEWEHLGKFAARLDDVVNFIPARITALIILLAAVLSGKNLPRAWQIMLRDCKKTQSPNAGWTMSAMAGALGVQLEKVGQYKLGDNHCTLSLETIDASQRIIAIAAFIWVSLLTLAEVIYLVST